MRVPAAAILAVAGCCAAGCSASGPVASKATVPATVTLTGRVVVASREIDVRGTGCVSQDKTSIIPTFGPFDGIRAGARVVVRGGDSTSAAGTLNGGRVVQVSGETTCAFTFSVPDVPTTVEVYRVSVGNRTVTLRRQRLTDPLTIKVG